jgi:hypothetical protein
VVFTTKVPDKEWIIPRSAFYEYLGRPNYKTHLELLEVAYFYEDKIKNKPKKKKSCPKFPLGKTPLEYFNYFEPLDGLEVGTAIEREVQKPRRSSMPKLRGLARQDDKYRSTNVISDHPMIYRKQEKIIQQDETLASPLRTFGRIRKFDKDPLPPRVEPPGVKDLYYSMWEKNPHIRCMIEQRVSPWFYETHWRPESIRLNPAVLFNFGTEGEYFDAKGRIVKKVWPAATVIFIWKEKYFRPYEDFADPWSNYKQVTYEQLKKDIFGIKPIPKGKISKSEALAAIRLQQESLRDPSSKAVLHSVDEPDMTAKQRPKKMEPARRPASSKTR